MTTKIVENGKLESKLNVSCIIITNGQSISSNNNEPDQRSESLSSRCTKCVLENFELNYGPLTSECKEDVLKSPTSFMWKHFFDLWASFFVITPCVVAFWRGTWDYANIYLDKVAFNVGFLFWISAAPAVVSLFQSKFYMWSPCCGSSLVVIMLAFYSDNPSSNPTDS